MSEHPNSSGESAGDWLERALVEDARAFRSDYLDDDGFTARVMQSLPPRATLPAWRVLALAALWTTAALGLLPLLPDVGSTLANDVMRFVASYPITLSGIATGVVALAAASWLAAAIALRSEG